MNKANITKLFSQIKSLFLRNKKIAISAIIIFLIVCFFIFQSNKTDAIHIDTVVFADLHQSVRATGQVVSKTDLDLSFNKSGVVKMVKVAVGDMVTSGQILATLDQGEAVAKLTSARGALLSAQAKYNKTVQGSSSEEVTLAQVVLKNAQNDLNNVKNTQTVLVSNAYQNLLNSSIEALSASSSSTQTAPTISGTYVGNKEGQIKVSVYQGGSGSYFSTSGLVIVSGIVSSSAPQPIGSSGLFIEFPSSTASYQNDWIITIPNTQASDYLTNYNAYQNALRTQSSTVASAEALVDQKQAELDLKKAQARQSDVDIANADVISAQGALQSAQASYEDTVIRAPAGGTITKADIKYGELAEAGKAVITVEDVSNLYIEALINESNIAYLKLGQSVAITFDAFGTDKKFTGAIAHIDPSAQQSDGVVNYKIKVSITEIDATIRPGMNANIDVLAGEREHVVVVPAVAVTTKEGKSFVQIITDEKKEKYEAREIVTGFVGDNNLVEIISGVQAGDLIALIVK